MKKKNEKSGKQFLVAMLLLCLLLFLKWLTGEVCHIILGILLLGMSAMHIGKHIGKLKHKKKSVQIVDVWILIALSVVIVSGVLLHPLQGMLIILMLHKISSVCFVVEMIVHVLQHRS
ncbi:MAG: hypothetical protein ACI4DK_04295 [Lachnospiraceae bacterium]